MQGELVQRPEGGSVKAKIVVDDVKKSYPTAKGTLQVLGGISFSVEDGRTLAIVGPSGCGKSTLLRIVAGFDRPAQGFVRVDDVVRNGPSPKGIVIPQQGSLFPWLTVRQNLMFGLNHGTHRENSGLADQYIELVGLAGFEKSYPHELSGGMLKRVELARALVVKPQILYMDEPFAALDALMSLRMRNELLRILEKERHTLILVTHDVEEAIHLADRVLVLSQRPSTIKASFDVPFAHPRRLTSPEAQSLKESILRELGLLIPGVA
jgi:ABC-type nitrate/sulfonate/bicarbonate transport system ATPase subunit